MEKNWGDTPSATLIRKYDFCVVPRKVKDMI